MNDWPNMTPCDPAILTVMYLVSVFTPHRVVSQFASTIDENIFKVEIRPFALARNKNMVRCWVYEDPFSASFANMIASDGLSRSRIPSSYSENDSTNAAVHKINRPDFPSTTCR